MTRFQDYLKAEIFAETFSKIFFSGSSGRSVALVFAITYAFFSTVFAIVSFFLRIVFAILGSAVSAYLNSRFRSRRKALAKLKRTVREFGDRMEIRKGNGWTAYEIAGIGLRTGDFRIALAHHPKTGAVRIFRSLPEGQNEFSQGEIRPLLDNGAAHARFEDFPPIYRNLRTHVLWRKEDQYETAHRALARRARPLRLRGERPSFGAPGKRGVRNGGIPVRTPSERIGTSRKKTQNPHAPSGNQGGTTMKSAVLLVILSVLAFASASQAAERTQDEIRLIQSAEEISASAMDDDEKIERLTRIEAQVRDIRNRRSADERSLEKADGAASSKSSRPVSTLVREQVRKTVRKTEVDDDDEPEPTPLMRFGFWILRLFGWTIVLGLSAAVVMFVGIVVVVFIQGLEEKHKARVPRACASPGNSVTRDGVVPSRLR